MATNTTLKRIYQDAIDNKFGYDLTSALYHREVDVGTSKPVLYSSCQSFANNCKTAAEQSCQSYIVKKGIGINHEFIDAPLAALFLNDHKMETFLTLYPRDGYNLVYIDNTEDSDKLSVIGIASPLICSFQSLTDIIKQYMPKDSKGDPNINSRGFPQRDYLNKLNDYFDKTEPQSISDYYVGQYISGGGDPNPGNFGFAEVYPTSQTQYQYVIAKVDLGASFKNYSKISGSKPSLEYNKYAFTIPDNIQSLLQLYNHVIKDGNILMPGSAYDCEQRAKNCQWSGQGNVGLYNGQYKKSNAYGINMGNYVKVEHLQDSLNKLCKTNREDIPNIFKSSARKIHELLYNSQEKEKIPLIKENEEVFYQYIEGRSDFINSRYEHLCNFMKEAGIQDNDEHMSIINTQPVSYAWYENHSPYVYMATAGTCAALIVGCIYWSQSHIHQD